MREVNRKHFRFPAYDDETGVKLKSEQKRVLFEGEADFLTKNNEYLRRNQQAVSVPKPKKEEKNYRRSSNRRATKAKARLEKHKENLPEYHPNLREKTEAEGRMSESRSTKMEEKKALKTVRSYFVPKYIPASIIPDPKKNSVSESSLIHSMEKQMDSYLLFDTEPTPFQEKKEELAKPASNSLKKADVQKAGVLERSLAGMIEESEAFEETGYFK